MLRRTTHVGSVSLPSARARLALALVGLAIASSGLVGLQGGAAVGAGPVTDGSDWGSQGALSSDSAVTVRWDNLGNPAESVVHRAGRQGLPHSGGSTYDDIAASSANAYQDHFGADNGRDGLTVRVSQTRGLTNQAVTVDISGAKIGPAKPGDVHSVDYFQVFQCWGGLNADGSPDPAAAQPDPSTCQTGAVGPDSVGGNVPSEQRRLVNDPLAKLGDWNDYTGDAWAPFTAINGEETDGTPGAQSQNKFFSAATTNELSNVDVSEAGAATRPFEIQTSVESAGLGCGRRADVPSTSTCWLVVVPRILGLQNTQPGPISPSIWGQRLQVKLDFRDVTVGCPGGNSRSLINGSELLNNAAESWTPGLCAAQDIALGYSRVGDEVARNQLKNGASTAIVTTEPPSAGVNAVAVPLAIAAPVIAYQVTYDTGMACPWKTEPATEALAARCGVASVTDLKDEIARVGTPIRDLRLDARLVAKLLTQSYRFSLIEKPSKPLPEWGSRDRPTFLTRDPEFRRLNPELALLNSTVGQDLDHLIVEALRSDGASAIWRWVTADPEAEAFLNGCPDPDGMIINPFYSTRTYEGCDARKQELSAQADADRAATTKSKNYADSVLVYPPAGSPYPLIGWQDFDRGEGLIFTTVDKIPPVDSMITAGREVARGHVPANDFDNPCYSSADPATCGPPPGKFPAVKERQAPGLLNIAAITDTATAARWRVPTASLCDAEGTACVGADATSLRRAADRFVADGLGWLAPAPADYADGGYPLTLPIYAAVNPSLPLAERQAYADAFEYATTTGQVPGFDPGDLMPGYAPLTQPLRDQAVAGIAQLRMVDPEPSPTPSPSAAAGEPVAVPTETPTPSPSPSPDETTSPEPSQTPNPTGSPTVASVTVPSPAEPSQEPVPARDAGRGHDGPVEVAMVALAAGTETWPSLTIPLGLALALLAGLIGPLVRLRHTFTVSR